MRQASDYEPQVQRVGEALVDAGFAVEYLCMRHPDRPRKAVVNGVAITSLPASRNRSGALGNAIDYAWFFLLGAATLTARHLRRPYTVVQIYSMPDFLVFAAAVPKLLGCRVIAYMNEPMPELFETLYGSPRLKRVLERIEQRVLRFADHAFTVTEQLKQRFVERGARADRITVVLNVSDPSSDLAGWSAPPTRADEPFTVVSHGSIEDRYGQDTIVEAAALLRDELPDMRVALTGRGSTVDELLALIDERDLGDVVRFDGWVSRTELNDLLHRAAVGIVAQKASSYSHLVHTYKMADYFIFGLPVIASRLDAVSDLYGDDVIEYYEPGNSVDLARAIRHLYDDPVRRDELARNGRLAHERLGWAVQRHAFLDAYEALLGNRPGDARPRTRADSAATSAAASLHARSTVDQRSQP
jgi:glycosyltransferase involved in cell wall biosynthesis